MIAESVEDFPDEVVCQHCPPQKAKQPRSAFYINKRTRRGVTKLEIKPICRECKAKQARGYRERYGAASKLVSRKAPINAVVKMCETHPDIFAEIVHRYKPVFEPILIAERARLTANMESVTKANRSRRKYTYDNLEKEYQI